MIVRSEARGAVGSAFYDVLVLVDGDSAAFSNNVVCGGTFDGAIIGYERPCRSGACKPFTELHDLNTAICAGVAPDPAIGSSAPEPGGSPAPCAH